MCVYTTGVLRLKKKKNDPDDDDVAVEKKTEVKIR